jgi:endonuclease YncB( thermonuclease family)
MATKRRKNHITAKELLKKGIPAVLIPGFMAAFVLGWNGGVLQKMSSWRSSKMMFPNQGTVKNVEDGDTFVLDKGQTVRLIGVNAPDRGESDFDEAAQTLSTIVKGKKVYLEYDRYQDDKYGRILSWVWVGCEKTPLFSPATYMHKSKNESNEGLLENPEGCVNGMLVNEEMVKMGFAEPVVYADRGALKYESRISRLGTP